jgi:6-phosphogluconolactonase
MIYKLEPIENAERDLSDRLQAELASGQNVLWLVSGGSNILPTVDILKKMPEDLTDKLSIMLIHERYGEPGHPDSNWQQFLDAGLKPKKAKLIQILKEHATFDQTLKHYNNTTAEAFAENDILIAQLGMGPDGHVAGILPHSVAAQTTQLVVGYEHKPYKRLTLTLSALEMMDAIYVLAYGKHKRDTILKLHSTGLAAEDQPAQYLKQLAEVYFYNDQVGE